MTFSYLFRRHVILLSTPMLKDDDCPLRTLNSGCTIPLDLSYFEDSFRSQTVKFIGDETGNERNPIKLFALFAHVMQTEGYNDPGEVVWSVAIIIDHKISGTAVLNTAYLTKFTDGDLFLIISRVPHSTLKTYRTFAPLPARVPLAPKRNANQPRILPAAPSKCSENDDDDNDDTFFPKTARWKCRSETPDSDTGLVTEDDAEVDLLSLRAEKLHLSVPSRAVQPYAVQPRAVQPRAVTPPPLAGQSFEVSFVSQKHWRLTPTTCFLSGIAASYDALVAQVSALRQFAIVKAKKGVQIVAMEFKWENGTQVAFDDQHGYAMAMAQVARVREEEEEVVQLMVVMEKV